MPTPISIQKVNIAGNRYYSVYKDGNNTTLTEQISEADYEATKTTIPTKNGYTWVSAHSQIAFDTPSGDLSDGQYATQGNGFHWVKIPGYSMIKIENSFIKTNTLTVQGIAEVIRRAKPE